MASFDVVEFPETNHVTAGDIAPKFTRPLVNSDYWENVSLSELTADGPVLLFAHPMDGTGIAKSTWVEIRNRSWGGGDLTVVGISISTPYEHKHLIDRHDLPYKLFSDPGNGVAGAYGIVHDYHGMAELQGHRPAFFLIDTDRTVVYAWVADEWPPSSPYNDVEAAIDSL